LFWNLNLWRVFTQHGDITASSNHGQLRRQDDLDLWKYKHIMAASRKEVAVSLAWKRLQFHLQNLSSATVNWHFNYGNDKAGNMHHQSACSATCSRFLTCTLSHWSFCNIGSLTGGGEWENIRNTPK
jgi:hypothetical protein